MVAAVLTIAKLRPVVGAVLQRHVAGGAGATMDRRSANGGLEVLHRGQGAVMDGSAGDANG